jgi:hypothetical protein
MRPSNNLKMTEFFQEGKQGNAAIRGNPAAAEAEVPGKGENNKLK